MSLTCSLMTRRSFLATGAFAVGLTLQHAPSVLAQPSPAPATSPVGPMVGHVDEHTAYLWFRPGKAIKTRLIVLAGSDRQVFDQTLLADVNNDFCITWRVDKLTPDTSYRYRIMDGAQVLVDHPGCVFRTAPVSSQPARVALAIGSCASSTEFPDMWRRMAIEGCDAVVLGGDTPYIDSSKIDVNRAKHRQFLAQPGLSELITSHPVWATWDDHDFGRNDSDGSNVDRDTIRKVFTEYRALASFGNGKQGIYTSFRLGPVELFLIDARYFSQTEPSPVAPDQKTLLGKDQWNWLRAALKASDAPFKILMTGMVWHNKPNKEKDKWTSYMAERDALFAFLGKEKITGVILIGGDIHVSCLLKYDTAAQVGYPLHEFVSSPLHQRILPDLTPSKEPGLVWAQAKPNVFLRVVADSTLTPASLTATWIQRDGTRLHEITLATTQLASPVPDASNP
ncbi:MAG: alkaline phosphatase D family protein [Phycisphaeraceae bacterium]